MCGKVWESSSTFCFQLNVFPPSSPPPPIADFHENEINREGTCTRWCLAQALRERKKPDVSTWGEVSSVDNVTYPTVSLSEVDFKTVVHFGNHRCVCVCIIGKWRERNNRNRGLINILLLLLLFCHFSAQIAAKATLHLDFSIYNCDDDGCSEGSITVEKVAIKVLSYQLISFDWLIFFSLRSIFFAV